MLTGKTVAAMTLGCKTNQYETDSMMELLSNAGATTVSFEDMADIYLVNTCSVTNIADKKSRQMLHRAKKKNPNAVVIAAGCYAQAAKDTLLAEEHISFVIGNNKKKDIVRLVATYLANGTVNEEGIIDISKEKEYEALRINKTQAKTRAYVKIQDGCNQFCTYCIIPYVRGRIRSRDLDDIVAEVTDLAANGVKEVVLTGIHISSYGVDKDNVTNLADVIDALTQIQSIERIRLGSLEPKIITEAFIDRIKDNKKLCPHFHLSLQSGCDSVLKRMNRKYTTAEYFEKCDMLRGAFDRPALTTDVIVGFPGETEEEFEATFAYLERLNLYEMHIFKYSPRKGTVAASMPNQIDGNTKHLRSERLIALSNRNKKAYEETFAGEPLQVLVERTIEKNGETYYVGHTERYMEVEFTPEQLCAEGDVVNTIVTIEKPHNIY